MLLSSWSVKSAMSGKWFEFLKLIMGIEETYGDIYDRQLAPDRS